MFSIQIDINNTQETALEQLDQVRAAQAGTDPVGAQAFLQTRVDDMLVGLRNEYFAARRSEIQDALRKADNATIGQVMQLLGLS
jgi:hypothetical protein